MLSVWTGEQCLNLVDEGDPFLATTQNLGKTNSILDYNFSFHVRQVRSTLQHIKHVIET